MDARNRFAGLEIGRGFAALLVVIHHAANIAAEPRFTGVLAFGGQPKFFYVGVDFFFVLSGFIIAWVHSQDIGRPEKIAAYVRKRFLRIYPPYWGVLFALVVLYRLVPGSGDPAKLGLLNIITSALLAPSSLPPVLGVAWTLVHEILFYLVFGLVILVGPVGKIIFPIWAFLILAWNYFGGELGGLSFLFSPFNFEFLIGVGAAFWLRKRSAPWPVVLICLGGAIFMLAMLAGGNELHDQHMLSRLVFGFSSMLFVVGVVSRQQRDGVVHVPNFVWFFGASSYAVYLTHTISIIATARILGSQRLSLMSVEYAVIALTVVGLAGGFLYYRIVERPILAVLYKLFSRDQTSRPVASP